MRNKDCFALIYFDMAYTLSNHLSEDTEDEHLVS